MAMESNSNPNSEEQPRNWLELPEDITSMILLKLGAVDILFNAQNVCSLWRKICKDPLMWRVVDMQNFDDLLLMDCEKMFMHAVDRSCGQLVDINFDHFGTDELLHYITQSSNQLRRLRFVYCIGISDKGFTEAVSKLPLLEDLEIGMGIHLGSFDVETLKTVGRCCPLLKSLTLNRRVNRRRYVEYDEEYDEEAVAIGENMPNLQHLQIFGNNLTDRGLQVILDGCPYLESLDLRGCLNLNLAGRLGIKCAERIKSLRLPRDPTDDCGFYDELVDSDYGFYDELVDSDFDEFLMGVDLYDE